MDDEASRLAQELGRLLLAKRLMLATAESCTGGWMAKLVTDVAGSSGWFERGFVTYSNPAKIEMLGVAEQTLAASGAVSGATVTEMAEGVLAHSHADVTAAISGIAGPGGGTPDKPVGLVWIAWSRRGGHTQARQYYFAGDRESVRLEATMAALRGLIAQLEA